jgi:hypothetical protein
MIFYKSSIIGDLYMRGTSNSAISIFGSLWIHKQLEQFAVVSGLTGAVVSAIL